MEKTNISVILPVHELNEATKEDLKQIDPNARTISLEDAVRQNGGSLNMEQMMKLMDG